MFSIANFATRFCTECGNRHGDSHKFCGKCGSPVFSETPDGMAQGMIFIKAGTLDEGVEVVGLISCSVGAGSRTPFRA